jgi:hypothetical protein
MTFSMRLCTSSQCITHAVSTRRGALETLGDMVDEADRTVWMRLPQLLDHAAAHGLQITRPRRDRDPAREPAAREVRTACCSPGVRRQASRWRRTRVSAA